MMTSQQIAVKWFFLALGKVRLPVVNFSVVAVLVTDIALSLLPVTLVIRIQHSVGNCSCPQPPLAELYLDIGTLFVRFRK